MNELVNLLTKVLLSGALVLLAAIFLWQVWRIWGYRGLVLAPFDFLESGTPAAASGEQFARMIRTDLVQLARLYNQADVANPRAVPRGDTAAATMQISLPAVFDTSFFDSVELKAYGIEIGSLFKSLRRHIESPSEITGSVTHQDNKYSVFLELKQAGAGKDSLRRWHIEYVKDVPEATHSVACRIFRHLASTPSAANPDAPLFQRVDDEDFCLFNKALASYDQYLLRKAVLSADDANKLLADSDSPLANLLGRQVSTFPYVYKLAALVYFEQGKYTEAENAVSRYITWLGKAERCDSSAKRLLEKIKARKLQTTPALSPLRPLRPGTSVGLLGVSSAGMICCVVRDQQGTRYIVGPVQILGSTAGRKVLQPAEKHGGTEADAIGVVDRSTSTMTLVKLNDDVDVDAQTLKLGAIKGIDSKPGVNVALRTYGFDGIERNGTVISTPKLAVESASENGTIAVQGAIVTSSLNGEIGGPVLSADGKLVGMIFATSQATTLLAPIEPVLTELQVELMH